MNVWPTPRLDVKLDCFAEIGPRAVSVSSLRSDAQNRAAGDVPATFFIDGDTKAKSHCLMLSHRFCQNKSLQSEKFASH